MWGYSQPISLFRFPQADSFEELNASLRQSCLDDRDRTCAWTGRNRCWDLASERTNFYLWELAFVGEIVRMRRKMVVQGKRLLIWLIGIKERELTLWIFSFSRSNWRANRALLECKDMQALQVEGQTNSTIRCGAARHAKRIVGSPGSP